MADEYYNSVFTGEEIDAILGGAVRGDVAQTKAETWKAQARQNLGAASAAEDEAWSSAIENTIFYDANNSAFWSQGAISFSAGTNTNSTTRIRTVQIPPNIKKLSAGVGYKYQIYAFDGTTYVGIYDGEGGFAKAVHWLTGETFLSVLPDYRFRIVLATSEDGTITPDAYTNIALLAATDEYFAEEGIASDALMTGVFLESALNCVRQIVGDSLGKRPLLFKPEQHSSQTTSAVGQTLGTRPNATVVSAVEPCVKGDQIRVHVNGPVGITRGWYFVDADMTVISYASAAGALIDTTLTAPAGAAYVVVQNRLEMLSDGFYAYKIVPAVSTLSTTQASLLTGLEEKSSAGLLEDE